MSRKELSVAKSRVSRQREAERMEFENMMVNQKAEQQLSCDLNREVNEK